MANNNTKSNTVANRAIFSPCGQFIVKIDAVVNETMTGDRLQYKNYDTAVYVKIVDRSYNNGADVAKVYLPAHIALGIDSHAISAGGFFDHKSGQNLDKVITFNGAADQRGVTLVNGQTAVTAPLDATSLRGLIELIKCFVHVAETISANKQVAFREKSQSQGQGYQQNQGQGYQQNQNQSYQPNQNQNQGQGQGQGYQQSQS